MMNTKDLLNKYKSKFMLTESAYSKSHGGEKLSTQKKIATAKVMENVSNFLSENFTPSMGTQFGDLGKYQKFAVAITNVVLPNLIANDIAVTMPMTSVTGYITYVKFVTGNAKGDIKANTLVADPFKINGVHDFTGNAITETVATDGAQKEVTLAWAPVVKEAFTDGTGAKKAVKVIFTDSTGAKDTVIEYLDVTLAKDYIDLDATNPDRATQVPGKVNDYLGTAGFGGTTVGEVAKVTIPAKEGYDTAKVCYFYNNTVVPQPELPWLRAEMDGIQLYAKARNVAIYYSAFASFQANKDYNYDLGKELAKVAVAQIQYDTDLEIINLAIEGAKEASVTPAVVFNKADRLGVSKMEHYMAFGEALEEAKVVLYQRTKRFQPNFMLISADILPVLAFVKGFNATANLEVAGAYQCGTYNGIKVFVHPSIEAGTFVMGCNYGELQASALLYAPYMTIVPTQLLGLPDGGNAQGWSTMYDARILNKDLLVWGKVVNIEPTATTTANNYGGVTA